MSRTYDIYIGKVDLKLYRVARQTIAVVGRVNQVEWILAEIDTYGALIPNGNRVLIWGTNASDSRDEVQRYVIKVCKWLKFHSSRPI